MRKSHFTQAKFLIKFIFQSKAKLLTLNKEKAGLDKSLSEVQLQIEAEKKKFEAEEDKLANIEVQKD